MRALLCSLPAGLSLMALGAHFLRGGSLTLAAACALACGGLFFGHPRVLRVLQILLAGGAGLWLLTAWRIAEARVAVGAPWGRMAVILGGVAAFSLFSAGCLGWRSPPQSPDPRGGRSAS